MALQATSSVRFRDHNGRLHSEPKEWVPYTLEINVPAEHWREVQFTIQGERHPLFLASFSGLDVVCAHWPRSGTGHYQLRWVWPDGEREQTITIVPSKFSLDSFNSLLDDLEQKLPASVAIALQRAGALTGLELPRPDEDTLAGELVRIRRALFGTSEQAGLLTLLTLIGSDPHQVLRRKELWTPRWRTRQPHPTGLQKALARGHNRASDKLPNHILDTYVEHSVDVYENRVLKLFTRQVESRLRRLGRLLKSKEREDLRDEVNKLLFQLHVARRDAQFLDHVSPVTGSPTDVSMVLVKQPAYRSMFQRFLEFRRSPVVRFHHPSLDAPLANLPHLYQVWGTLTALHALAHIAPGLGFRVRSQELVRHDVHGLFVEILPRQNPILELEHEDTKTKVRVWPERSYRQESKPVRSISYSQRPDLVVEFTDISGSTSLIVFDPKYKLRSETLTQADEELPLYEQELKPIKADVDKMHTYRDALRGHGDNRIVTFAATLYPGETHWFGRDLAALGAIPGHTEDLLPELEAIFTHHLKSYTS